jgi:hypothetical protein
MAVYTAFAILVLASWFCWPPRRPRGAPEVAR